MLSSLTWSMKQQAEETDLALSRYQFVCLHVFNGPSTTMVILGQISMAAILVCTINSWTPQMACAMGRTCSNCVLFCPPVRPNY